MEHTGISMGTGAGISAVSGDMGLGILGALALRRRLRSTPSVFFRES